MHKLLFRMLIIGGALLLLGVLTRNPQAAQNDDAQSNFFFTGAVFVGTNHNNTQATDPNEPANQVAMYRRGFNGALSLVGYFDTGGQGSGPSVRFAGDGLGSSHSVELSQDRRWLLVANAASNNISVFRVFRNRLELVEIQSSCGVFPNSIAQHDDMVYVLNAAGAGNIAGFRLSNQGRLTPIPNSTRVINANQDPVRPDTLFNPTQISFTPDGEQLVVTIKDGPVAGAIPGAIPTGPGRILVFNVDRDGRASQTFRQTNLNNLGPFGFSFDRRGNLLTTLFVGGPNLTGAVASFRVNRDGSLTAITANAPNLQGDTCWIENNGRFAFAANYTSGTISSYIVGNDGSLSLLASVAGTTNDLPGPPGKVQGSTPLDIRLSPDGRFLYDVLPGSGAVAAWRINNDGSLTKIGEFPGLPDTINGDSAPFEFGPGGSPAGIAVL
jgi:6-phosphogluconolactonase